MKERPILFKGPLVRAILEGRKTVTRRALKMPHGFWETSATGELVPISVNCPYGKPGDRLWVRETFGEVYEYCDHPKKPGCPTEYWHIAWKYRADGETPEIEDGVFTGWKPSIHMPRAACRIMLEITNVRVERLQDISRADIRAEGLQCPPELASDDVSPNYRDWYPAAWRELWESTGGDWKANPWVWVIEFKRVTPP